MEKALNTKIKAIWDFRGPNTAHTAEHFRKHLEEFALAEQVTFHKMGVEHYSPSHSIVFMVVSEDHVKKVRSLLRPNRGERYSET